MIEILLLGLFFICVVGVIILYSLIFLNINIFEAFKQSAKDIGLTVKDEFWQVHDISPTKVIIGRVPETGYEFQIYKFAYAWNGKIALLDFEDNIQYIVNNKHELQMDDELSILRGDDTYVLNIITHGYKLQQHERVNNLIVQNALLKEQNKNLMKMTEENLLAFGNTLRESKKAINWNANTGTAPPFGLNRRLPFMGSNMVDDDQQDMI